MTPPTTRAESGARAEAVVVRYLEQHGYRIVDTNLRLGRLEVDIVARQGDVIVLVEVRTRGPGAWTSALGSIDPQKRARIRRAGERLWQRRYRNDSTANRMRFDVAAVDLQRDPPEVEYLIAAL